MTIHTWPTGVNTKFFSYSKQPNDNSIVSEFISGRVTGYKRNTRSQFHYNCKLILTKDEEQIFWEWFNDFSLVGAFECAALGSGYYRFVSVPSPDDTDQQFTKLNFEIEQVY